MAEEQIQNQTAEPAAPAAPAATETRTFTQDDVNNLIAKESRKAVEKAMSELGVTDAGSAKEALAKAKELMDAQKSNEQKLAEQIKAESERATLAEQKAAAIEAKFAALAKGIDAGKAEKAAKLAQDYEGDTIDAKLDAMLKDFPEFIKQTTAPAFGAPTQNTQPSKDAALMEIIRANM